MAGERAERRLVPIARNRPSGKRPRMVDAGPPNLPTWKRGCTLGSKIGGHPEGKELIPQKQLRSNRQKSLMDQEHRASMPRIAADDVCRLACREGRRAGRAGDRTRRCRPSEPLGPECRKTAGAKPELHASRAAQLISDAGARIEHERPDNKTNSDAGHEWKAGQNGQVIGRDRVH
jgi:hypothetical protein